MSSFCFRAGLVAGLFAFAVGVIPAAAQDYPARSITVIVPFAAGGPTDVVARIVGDHMSKTLGQTLVIENMLGAGGTTASTRAMRASPDGYTIIMGHMGTHAASVALYPNLAYKPDVDFEPIGMAAGTPILILSKKDFGPKDLKEFVTYVKANETKLNMAHAGVGSVSHVTGLLLNHLLGVKPTLIPLAFVMSKATSCGCNPTCWEIFMETSPIVALGSGPWSPGSRGSSLKGLP